MKKLEKMLVCAGKHGPVAKEHNSTRFIGSEPEEIELSAYYLRRIADGELVPVAPKSSKKDKE